MGKLLATTVLFDIYSFFSKIGQFMVDTFGGILSPNDLLFYLSISIFVVIMIITYLRTIFCYEVKLMRNIDLFTRFLIKNPYVNEENLIEFNRKFKKFPKVVRTCWQRYILDREKKPSDFMTVENCVDRPLKVSDYDQAMKSHKIGIKILYVITLLLGFAGVAYASTALTSNNGLLALVFNIVALPTMIYIINALFTLVMKGRQNAMLSDIYSNFGIFQKAVDRAVTTMPEYIDYQVLFTAKEIRDGIPALQEFLEQREIKEREELERIKKERIEHEKYNFDELNIRGQSLLQRAINESEAYISNRKRLIESVEQYQQELDSYKRNFETVQREQIKKEQTLKENVERLRIKLEECTSRFEANSLNKQIDEEQAKRELLEKEIDSTTKKYSVGLKGINDKINAAKAQIEEKREYIENAMILEFKSYTSKLYAELEVIANRNSENEKQNIIAQKEEFNQKLQSATVEIEKQAKQINELNKKYEQKILEENNKNKKYDQFTNELKIKEDEIAVLKEEINKLLSEPQSDNEQTVDGYYDEKGNYVYANGAYYDTKGFYHDTDGQVYTADGELVEEKKSVKDKKTKKTIKENSNNVEEALQKSKNEDEPVFEDISIKAKEEIKPRKEIKTKSSKSKNLDAKEKVVATKKKEESKASKSTKEATKKPTDKNTKGKTTTTKSKSSTKKSATTKTTKNKKVATINSDDFEQLQRKIDEENKKLVEKKLQYEKEVNDSLGALEGSEQDKEIARQLEALYKIKQSSIELSEQAEKTLQKISTQEQVNSMNKRLKDLLNDLDNYSNSNNDKPKK